jgi:predicted RNA-binding protein
MCLATVYVEDGGQREEVMRDVAWIKPESGGLQLITFLGEGRLFQAKIKSVDLVNGLIVLERMTADSAKMVPGDQKGKPVRVGQRGEGDSGGADGDRRAGAQRQDR